MHYQLKEDLEKMFELGRQLGWNARDLSNIPANHTHRLKLNNKVMDSILKDKAEHLADLEDRIEVIA